MRKASFRPGILLLVAIALTPTFLAGQTPMMAAPPHKYPACNKPGPPCNNPGPIIPPCTSWTPPCPPNVWAEDIAYNQCNDQDVSSTSPCQNGPVQCGWYRKCQLKVIYTNPPTTACEWGPVKPTQGWGC
jgi:hypothetical protein